MTQPPDDPRYPQQPPNGPQDGLEHPPTRSFDPSGDSPSTSAYSDPGYVEPYYAGPQGGGYDQAGYQQGGYPPNSYAQDPYGQDPYGGQPPYGEPEPPKKSTTGRTVGLVLAVLAGLVVIGLVAALVLRGGSESDDSAGPAPSTTTTTTPEPTTTTTTTEPTTTTTTTTSVPGRVVFQLTGSGDVVALRYTGASGTEEIVAATGTPWSQTVTIAGTSAEMSAIVINGPVTCSIMQDGEQLATRTSNGGLVRCAATIPAG